VLADERDSCVVLFCIVSVAALAPAIIKSENRMGFFDLKPHSVVLGYPAQPGVFWSPILSTRDILLVTCFGLFIFILRALLTKFVFLPLAHYFGECSRWRRAEKKARVFDGPFCQPSTSGPTP
jgi:hypothetical protein